MSKNQISFTIIEYKPIIPDITDYSFQILCYDTKFKDYISCLKNNKVSDYTNIKKNLKYIIKLTKKGKIFGVGNLTISQEIFSKKIKRKKYNNINIFITGNNYKTIFPKIELYKINQFQTGINLTIEVNIKYNVKEKEISQKKLKLMRRNFSFQDRVNYKNDHSNKSSNILTTSNTFNNINNCCDNNNNNDNENNLNNIFSADRYIISTPPYIMSPSKKTPSLSASKLNNKRKIIKRGIFDNLSFKNNIKNKNKIFKNKRSNSNLKYNLFDFKNKLNQKPSRNKENKYLYHRKKLNEIIPPESFSSNHSNTITQSSIIDSALIEKNDDDELLNVTYITNLNYNDTIQNTINNKSAYNKDNDIDYYSLDIYLKEIENKKNKVLNDQRRINRHLFNQEEIYNKLSSTLNNYENKMDNTKKIIDKLREKNVTLKNKEKIIVDVNKEIMPIITKVKESKEIEENIINIVLYTNENKKNNNFLENNIEKYDKNLMIKMLKNVIQSNHNVDLYLKDENKKRLKNICDKYNIFGSIIEDVEE